MTEFVLDDFLPYRLALATARVSRAFEQRYQTEAGLSVAEWRVLAHLSQQPEISVREIEARTELEKSRVSRAASRLEAQGLITKQVNTGDRRLICLTLTAEGRALMARLAPLAAGFQAELQNLLGENLASLEASLRALNRSRL